MLQLFQPTNIYPDVRGSFGNGVVVNPLMVLMEPPVIHVSWQVNGNTPMTAFQLDFYKNDGSGDFIWSTGKLTDGCPFYSVDQNGNPILFTYVLTTTNDDIGTYDEAQMKITQWWGSDSSDCVVQSSPSVYVVRPTLESDITNYPTSGLITERSFTFNGSLSSGGGFFEEDGLMWHRWVLYQIMDGTKEVLKDTGRIYGNAQVTFTYDGFLPGTYYIKLTGETSLGVVSTNYDESVPGWQLNVEYSLDETGMVVTASKSCKGDSAVLISWPLVSQIPLVDSVSPYSAVEDYITVGAGVNDTAPNGMMKWNQVNGSAMRYAPGWSFVWRGILTLRDADRGIWENDLVTIKLCDENGTSTGRIEFQYPKSSSASDETKVVILYYDTNDVATILQQATNFNGGNLLFAITSEGCYISKDAPGADALYPSDYLYPNSSLYPSIGQGIGKYIAFDGSQASKYNSYYISEIVLKGPQSVQIMKVTDYEIENQVLVDQYLGDDINLAYDAGTVFLLCKNSVDYDGGNYYVGTVGTLAGLSVYRKTGDNNNLELVGNVGKNVTSILDYAARSQQGPYTYYLYVKCSDKFTSLPSISNTVDPCFWNWAVLSCTKNSDGTYEVQKSYLFGKNLNSGTVSNNNKPGIFGNFTRYPLVQVSPQNYKSGTLRSLIGVIDGYTGEYSDTIDLRDELYGLSTNTNYLFLKDRKGDLIMIRPAGDISMELMDDTREQALTINFPWVETGDASNVSIYKVQA